MIDNTDQILDSRDIDDRIQELEDAAAEKWVAGWNMPGYLPDSPPEIYTDADGAKDQIIEWLQERREEVEQQIVDLEDKGVTSGPEHAELNRKLDAWFMAIEDVEATDAEDEIGVSVNGYFFFTNPADEEQALDPDEWEELEMWRGVRENDGNSEWSYGQIFIHEDYFTEYVIDMLKDCGDLPKDIPWYIAIDEDATAENLKGDYDECVIGGETYYTRQA